MSVWGMIFKEIGYRKGHFLLSLLAVAAAVASLIGSVTLLQAHKRRTEKLLSDKRAEAEGMLAKKRADVEARVAKMNDEIRKITKNLGFNILILPKDQNLHEVYAKGFGEKTMPEEFVTRLATSDIVVINHVLPSLVRKVEWTEQRRTVVLVGTRGEVPLANRRKMPEILESVPRGEAVLGYELHNQLQLKPGQSVKLMGRDFKVRKCLPARGNQDDITVWLNLGETQEMLDLAGRINAIYALECNCQSVDRIGSIRKEVAKLLPETQVLEFQSQAVARAEARKVAWEEGMAAVVAEREHQENALKAEETHQKGMQRERENLAGWLVPLILTVSALWIALLTYINVRARISEIGILRALGLGNSRILRLFLGKALVIGLIGAVVGFPLGFGLGLNWAGNASEAAALFDVQMLVLGIGLAPLLAIGASWLPAQVAARLDPALVLGEG